MKKTYLVTGGAGFIGSSLVRRMVREGLQVRVFDNLSRGRARRLEDVLRNIEFIEGDICDPRAVSEAAKGTQAVIHLAYINGTEFFYSMPERILEVAVKGLMNSLDACREHGIREWILASSSEVYQKPPMIPADESVPLVVPDLWNPRYSYGAGKIISEVTTIHYGKKYFDRAVIFRPHNVYGPDMGWEHVIPQFAVRMADLKAKAVGGGSVEFPIQGNGEETRSFIYIDDFVEALMRVLQSGKHLEVYNIGTEQEIRIADLAMRVGEALGCGVRLMPQPVSAGSVSRRRPDIKKIRGLGFEPRVSLKEGLRRTVEWYLAHQDEAPAGVK